MWPLRRIALIVPLLAVGVISFVYVRGEQGAGDQLLNAQRGARPLTAAAVAAVVRHAPSAVGGKGGDHATCAPLGAGELRNPWRCSISYRSGVRTDYLVTVAPNGSYVGTHQLVHYRGTTTPNGATIRGCCIPVP